MSEYIGDHYRDQLPYFGEREPLADIGAPPDGYTGPEVDEDGILVIADSPHGVCPDCLGALELFEEATYCPDCLSFGLNGPRPAA